MTLRERMSARLNSDGRPHPLENTLAVLAVALGLLAVVALVVRRFDAAAWLAFGGAVVAAYDEFIAKTQGERWLILTGFAVCLVALSISMANGAVF